MGLRVKLLLSIFAMLLFLGPVSANSLLLELGGRGTVDVTVRIDDSAVTGATTSRQLLIMFPFSFSNGAYFEKSDTTEITLLATGDTHSMVSVVFAAQASELTFKVRGALDVYAAVQADRAIFQLDLSYPNFVTHKSILGDSRTISEFDIHVILPEAYSIGDLSFQPSRDKWLNNGREWNISANDAVAAGSVFIAFPSPFDQNTDIGKFIIIGLSGLVGLWLGALQVPKYRGKKNVLIPVFAMSTVAAFVFGYFLMSVPNPLDFLVWGASISIAMFAVAISTLVLLVRVFFDCRFVGEVAIANNPNKSVPFAEVSISVVENGSSRELKRVETQYGGKYDVYVWIGRNKRRVVLSASLETFESASSAEIEVEAGNRIAVPELELEPTKA